MFSASPPVHSAGTRPCCHCGVVSAFVVQGPRRCGSPGCEQACWCKQPEGSALSRKAALLPEGPGQAGCRPTSPRRCLLDELCWPCFLGLRPGAEAAACGSSSHLVPSKGAVLRSSLVLRAAHVESALNSGPGACWAEEAGRVLGSQGGARGLAVRQSMRVLAALGRGLRAWVLANSSAVWLHWRPVGGTARGQALAGWTW